VIDRLEQAGYVRRTTDPADRRRVVVEIVPEKVSGLGQLMGSLERAAEDEVGHYSPDQIATINDFLSRMANLTQTEAARLRTTPDAAEPGAAPSEHTAPLGGLTSARLMFRAGAQDLRLRSSRSATELYRGRFEGAMPQVRLRDGRVLVQYRGIPFDWRKRTATLALNTTIPWSIEVVGGVTRLEADLRDVPVSRFELTGGTERTQIEFGRPVGELPVKLTGGARTIRIERPAGVPLRLRVVGGTGSVELDGQTLGAKGGDVAMEPGGWLAARDRISVEITGGSKSITVVER
jgi:hypothetical protein